MADFMTWEEENKHTFKKKKLKYIVSTPITDGPHETPELLDEGIPFLSAESVKNGILDFNYKRGYISLSDHKLFCKKVRPQKNDIFIVKSGATTGNCGIVTTDEEFSIWSPLALIRCDNISVLQKFIYYYSLCYSFTHQVEQSWSYGTQQNIGMGVLGNLYVTLPSSKEQQSIVDCLDKECARIDSIAADLENQIELLQQYKKSLITETVTKGLDKSMPMKDSGVEWIGKIPDHWQKTRIKFEASIIGSGTTPDSGNSMYYDNGEHSWIQSGDLYGKDYIYETEKQLTNLAILECRALNWYTKDFVVVAMYGASVGNVAISKIDSFTNQACCVIKLNEENDNRYLFYFLKAAQEEMLLKAFGGTQPNISQVIIRNLNFLNVPLLEQIEIADFLDSKCNMIDEMLQSKKEQYDILIKHKKSLIYEYVTGKKRVKEVQ